MAIKWTKSMKTGDAVVDGQHKEFLDYLNSLSENLGRGVDLGDVRVAIDTLSKYITVHFDYEEKIIKKDESVKHKHEHEKVKKYFEEFKHDFMGAYTKPNLSSQKLKEILKKLFDALSKNYVSHMLTAKEIHQKR